ncbi:MAG: imidazole glycerol phosphate synthase subunit HisH [Alphaproteobacteria bacterium]
MTTTPDKTPSIYLVDLESGNLHSVERALGAVALRYRADRGADGGGDGGVICGRNPQQLRQASHIVIPGVGAFPALASRLHNADGLKEALIEARGGGVPILGICVGMQLLATLGREYGDTAGLNWIEGEVDTLPPPPSTLKVPHMGWSEVRSTSAGKNSDLLPQDDWFYFAHSFHFCATHADDVAATFSWQKKESDIEQKLTAAVCRGAVWGVQFHPEKSGRAGLELLARFLAQPQPSPSPSL